MAARAISSGTISFGLLSLPVKVHTAASAQPLRFNMLDAPHRQRSKQQDVSVHGYTYAKAKGAGRARGKSGAK